MRRARIEFPAVAVKDGNGLVLRVLPSAEAADRWIAGHVRGGKAKKTVYRSPAAVRGEFDRQMRIGLTDTAVIGDLLWYGGVSSTRGSCKAKAVAGKRHNKRV